MSNLGNNGVSSPTLTNVVFSGNQADYHGGGGELVQQRLWRREQPSLTNVTFSGNQTGGNGGGAANSTSNGESPVADQRSLQRQPGQRRRRDVQLYGIWRVQPALSNVTFSGNHATATAAACTTMAPAAVSARSS